MGVDELELTEDELPDAKLHVQGLWLAKSIPVFSCGRSEGEIQPDIPPSPDTPFATWQAQRQCTVFGNCTLDRFKLISIREFNVRLI